MKKQPSYNGDKYCLICDRKIMQRERWTTEKDDTGTHRPVHVDCLAQRKSA